jgi:Flp pilus assembly protein TadD
MSSEFTYQMSVDDFDKSLLPSHARTPGTDEFNAEVSLALEREYAEFGGWVQIVVNQGVIQVTWKSDPTRPKPLDVVHQKLERGELVDAVRLLEHLRRHEPENVNILTNLGMALSDLRQLEPAEQHLRRALELDPAQITARVGLSVVLNRRGDSAAAIRELQKAVKIKPQDAWAQRNLAAMLCETGDFATAEPHYRKAIELNPGDQQAKLEFGQCLLRLGNKAEADAVFLDAINIDSTTSVAEAARLQRTNLAQESFRAGMPAAVQPDAVMYCLAAIQKFEKMRPDEVKKIGFEIAVLGQRGLNTNDSTARYELKSMPGKFSGLQLVCTMFVAFKILTPDQGIGFDLEREYEAAKAAHRRGGGGGAG